MIVSICPTLFGNHLLIDADTSSSFDYLSRRISRTATLDGGCFIADNGYSASDGNITIVISGNKNTKAIQATITQLIQQFGLYTISSPYGFFLCAFDNITPDKGDLKLNFLIKEKVL